MSNFYGFLPTIIRHDQRVSDFGCRLYSELASLSNKFGFCYASNEYLGKVFGKSPQQISRVVSQMQKFGYISTTIEDGWKRRIYVKTDFRELEGVDENVNGGTQKDQGGYAKMRRGVNENVKLEDNKLNNDNLTLKEEKGKAQSIFQKIEELQQYQYLPDQLNTDTEKERKDSGQKKESEDRLKIVSEVIDYLNTKANSSFKATTKETMQFVLARQKVDGWELEDFKLVIDFKISQWLNDEKMRHNLNPSTLFRGVHAEKYLMSAKAWKESSKVGQNGKTKPGVVPLFRQENFSKPDKSKFKF